MTLLWKFLSWKSSWRLSLIFFLFWWGNCIPEKLPDHVFMIIWWANKQVRMSSQNRTSGSQTSVHYAFTSPFLDDKIGDHYSTIMLLRKPTLVIWPYRFFFFHLKLYSSNAVQFSVRNYTRKVLCMLCLNLIKCFN